MPYCCFRLCGVSRAAIFPLFMKATRSESLSASIMSWVVRNTVAPRSRSSRMMARMASDEAGSSPAVGSSRKSIRGRFTSDRATISRCFMPLE